MPCHLPKKTSSSQSMSSLASSRVRLREYFKQVLLSVEPTAIDQSKIMPSSSSSSTDESSSSGAASSSATAYPSSSSLNTSCVPLSVPSSDKSQIASVILHQLSCH